MKYDKHVQAKNLPDELLIRIIQQFSDETGVGTFLGVIQFELEPVPPKVVLAKLKSMVKRGILTGCTCGCRGDFTVKKLPDCPCFSPEKP